MKVKLKTLKDLKHEGWESGFFYTTSSSNQKRKRSGIFFQPDGTYTPQHLPKKTAFPKDPKFFVAETDLTYRLLGSEVELLELDSRRFNGTNDLNYKVQVENYTACIPWWLLANGPVFKDPSKVDFENVPERKWSEKRFSDFVTITHDSVTGDFTFDFHDQELVTRTQVEKLTDYLCKKLGWKVSKK